MHANPLPANTRVTLSPEENQKFLSMVSNSKSSPLANNFQVFHVALPLVSIPLLGLLTQMPLTI